VKLQINLYWWSKYYRPCDLFFPCRWMFWRCFGCIWSIKIKWKWNKAALWI